MWGCARSAVNPFRFFNSRYEAFYCVLYNVLFYWQSLVAVLFSFLSLFMSWLGDVWGWARSKVDFFLLFFIVWGWEGGGMHHGKAAIFFFSKSQWLKYENRKKISVWCLIMQFKMFKIVYWNWVTKLMWINVAHVIMGHCQLLWNSQQAKL